MKIYAKKYTRCLKKDGNMVYFCNYKREINNANCISVHKKVDNLNCIFSSLWWQEN